MTRQSKTQSTLSAHSVVLSALEQNGYRDDAVSLNPASFAVKQSHFSFPNFSLESNFSNTRIILDIHPIHRGGQLMVTNSAGEQYLYIPDASTSMTLEISHLEPDTYYVTLANGYTMTTKSFVKKW